MQRPLLTWQSVKNEQVNAAIFWIIKYGKGSKPHNRQNPQLEPRAGELQGISSLLRSQQRGLPLSQNSGRLRFPACPCPKLFLQDLVQPSLAPRTPPLTQVSCKLTQLDAEGGCQSIGTLEIDLELLAERSLLFLPFQEHDKVLEIKLYEQQRESGSHSSAQTRLQREEFLNKRFEFMDRITAH